MQARLSLKQLAAVRNRAVRSDQHHLIVFIGKPQHQNFGHELADLFGREIDNGGDLTADQEAWGSSPSECTIIFKGLEA